MSLTAGTVRTKSALSPPARAGRVAGLVSVVIPAYNAAASLARCIDQALAQTYRQTEVIVVNDGSTDATDDVVKQYGDRIQYIRQDNQGETAARNRGFGRSHGEFVTFVDHDDYWAPRFVETTVRFLRDYPEAVAVSVGHAHRTALQAGTTVHPACLAQARQTFQKAFVIERFFDFWFRHDHICAGSAMLRGSLIDQAGGQRTDLVLSGDMEYWAYLATFGKWGFIPQVLLNVDVTQVPRGSLYRKFHDRYRRCATVEDWETRIVPRLQATDRPGFERIRGRVATWYAFAHVFVGNDAVAKQMAEAYQDHLEGKVGRLWRRALAAGWLSWKLVCIATRVRTRLQYYLADRRR